jgi:hypothetical protein
MSVVNVARVGVLNNPADFGAPFAFEIEYECTSQLQDDLEWKMIYVGSAESEKYDQVLDSVLVGPVYPGNYKFTFEGDAPDPEKLQQEDVVGVTVILLTCSYQVSFPSCWAMLCLTEYPHPATVSPQLRAITTSIQSRGCTRAASGQGVHSHWVLRQQ